MERKTCLIFLALILLSTILQANYKIKEVACYYFPSIGVPFFNPFSYDVFIGNSYYSKDEGETFYPLSPHLTPTYRGSLENSIIRDKDDSNIIYMSLFNRYGGPLFAPFARSLDDGKNWEFVEDQFGGDLGGSWLCQDSAGTLYIITTQENLNSFHLYRSFDKGSTWQKVEIKKGKKIWEEFFIDIMWTDPEIPFFLYASFHRFTFDGYEGAILVSKDGGENWERRDNGIPHNSRGFIKYEYYPFSFTQSPLPPFRIYVVKGNGYAKGCDTMAYSDDRGKSWHAFEMKKDKSQFWRVRVDPRNPKILYAAGSAPQKNFGNPYYCTFYKSTNGGKSWKKSGRLVGDELIFGDKLTDYWDVTLTKSGRVITIGSQGIAVSDDYGETFQLKRKFFKPSVKGLLKTKRGTIVVGKWPPSPLSYDNGLSYKLNESSKLFWPVIDMGNGKLLSSGLICEDSEQPPPCYHFDTPPATRVFEWIPSLERIISANNSWTFYSSDDYGKNWVELGKLPQDDSFSLSKIVAKSDNPNMIVAVGSYTLPSERGRVFEFMDETSGAVFVSEDGGYSWEKTMDNLQIGSIISLRRDECNPNILVAGVVGGFTKGGVFVSEDFGKTWERRVDGLKPYINEKGIEFFSVVVSPVKDGVMYAAVNLNGGIYKSEDWGKHWTKISDNPVIFDEQFIKEFVYLGPDLEPNDHKFIALHVISMTDIFPLEDGKESLLISTFSDGLFLLEKED